MSSNPFAVKRRTTTLSASERRELAACEATIEHSGKTLCTELLKIRERRLYREHGTFDDYCQRRWGFGRRRGEQLAKAGSVMALLEESNANHGSHRLPNERQARQLDRLPDDDAKVQVWQGLCEAHPDRLTANDVFAAVHERLRDPDADAIEATASEVEVEEQPSQRRSGRLPARSGPLKPPRVGSSPPASQERAQSRSEAKRPSDAYRRAAGSSVSRRTARKGITIKDPESEPEEDFTSGLFYIQHFEQVLIKLQSNGGLTNAQCHQYENILKNICGKLGLKFEGQAH
jgi:hypothetical protein